MCIMPKVKKCEKTFALNVDIFNVIISKKIRWTNNIIIAILFIVTIERDYLVRVSSFTEKLGFCYAK